VKRSTSPGPLRWTIHHASSEFCVNRKTLERRLVETNTVAGTDNCYSTVQIVNALTGDIRAARLRKTRLEGDYIESKNQERRRTLLPASEVFSVLSEVFTIMKQEVLASGVPTATKNSLLSHLAEINIEGIAPAAHLVAPRESL
jgi:hypothetical protein